MRHSDSRSRSAYRDRILAVTFGFLVSSGVGISELRESIERALGSLKPKERLQRKPVVQITSVGAILYRWHNERRYLGDDAKPVPIRIRGRAPSLEALHRSEQIEAPLYELMRAMLDARLIRKKKSRYLPTRRSALVFHLGPFAIQHACDVIEGVLSTIANNTDPERRFTLVERAAIVRNLDAREFRSFCEFSHAQGSALADAVNDWLERRRTSSRQSARRGTIPVGVHIFAFRQPDGRRHHLS
jgi:hypothetical protein